MNEETRLKRYEARQASQVEAIRASKEIAVHVLSNPMFGLVAGVLVLEYAERKGWAGPIITTTAETGLIAVTTAQALAPIVPQIAQSGAGLAKLIPGLL